MKEALNTYHQTAGLMVHTATGEISKRSDKTVQIRLSPVNLRVLQVLLEQTGKVVNRQQLFAQVWPNQVVSDDALTRSVSDLRAQLKTLTDVQPLIDTIPKVGYRWVPEVESKTVTNWGSFEDTPAPSLWLRHIKPLLLALLIMIALSGALISWLKPSQKTSAVAILTTQVVATAKQQAVPNVATWLRSAALQQQSIQFLSSTAMQSHRDNPFPYYHQEFGVRWFIESQLNQNNSQLTLNLVDAKTALVIYSQTYPYKNPQELKHHCQTFVAFLATL